MADPSLKDFVDSVAGGKYLRVEEDLGDGFVRLKVSEAERRQAKQDIRCVEDIVVELLRNSRDAGALNIWVALSRKGDIRTITVIDDGDGIPPQMAQRVFEPRVTSKLDKMSFDKWGVHGRGMALFSIKSNAKLARVAASGVGAGAAIAVSVDLSDVPEKADQATYPAVERGEGGRLRVVRGPHNVIRRCVEFSLESAGVDVWLGSPAEILAALRGYAPALSADCATMDSPSPSDLAAPTSRAMPSLDGDHPPKVCLMPSRAKDAQSLRKCAEELGLEVSERSCRRVLAGAIKPLRPVTARLTRTRKKDAAKADPMRDHRGLRLSDEDLGAFKRDLEGAFANLAEKYYIGLRGAPHVSVDGGAIRVRYDVIHDD